MYVQVRVVVIYEDVNDHVYRLGMAATDGAWDAGGEVRIRRVEQGPPVAGMHGSPEPAEAVHEARSVPGLEAADLEWADVALFGTTTPSGTKPSRVAQLLDAAALIRHAGQLAEKVYGAFTPMTHVHRTHDVRVVSLLDVFHHWGGIVVPLAFRDPAGEALGHPLGASRLTMHDAALESELAAARSLGARATETARALKLGRRLLAEVA